MKLKHFYKINQNGRASFGSGYKIPDGFIEYSKGQEPQELLNALLIDFKKRKKQEIESAYNQAIQEPIAYNVGGSDYIFQSDEKSQDILSKVIVSAPAGFETDWLDIDNNPVHVTLDDLKGLAQAILTRGQQLFAKKVQLKQQVDACTTKEEVEAIRW
ncbi:DUF4376 domain-containing protein [Nitrosophilus kaiyonis]|uniref:DUF4376 domain-containing protein n=1 Tax=Nitrosophilus kaiyonis TaxID=2930200 RepID=UPI002491F79F|nr:DUF4376 domain-containing protein [Nitrosophilus kaiyonis]